MAGIKVERFANEGQCLAHQHIGDQVFEVLHDQSIVVVTFGELEIPSVWLSLDNASQLAEGLRSCLLDG